MIDWQNSPPFGRRKGLIHTLELLRLRRPNPLIIEVGTSEAYSPDGLGNAMLAFAWYASTQGARVKSVDVQNVENSKALLQKFCPEAAAIPEFFLADAFDWVTAIKEPIDLLYMDASFELSCDPSYGAFARRFAASIPSWYVELYNRFDPTCFESGSLMLFDDTDPNTYWGKGVHLIPKLLLEGWRQIRLDGVPVFPMALIEKI